MSKSLFTKRITAHSVEELTDKVQADLENGYDLYQPLFVSFEGELVQYMSPTKSHDYEYLLITAEHLDIFDTEIQNQMALGFDFFMNVVKWSGLYLQWMCRWRNADSSVKEVSASLPTQAMVLQ